MSNMENKKEKSKKILLLEKIAWPIFYIFTSVAVCISACVIFHNTYYTPIYVSGSSMQPTLNNRIGNTLVDFGIADCHQQAIDRAKRFDVVITEYPWEDEGQGLKIKRIWGLPGENIILSKSSLTSEGKIEYTFKALKNDVEIYNISTQISSRASLMTFDTSNKSFNIKRREDGAKDRSFNVKLNDNEYFLMGDNWIVSSDCYSNKKTPAEKENIKGVVIQIEGYAHLNADYNLENKVYTKIKYNF